MLFGVLGARWLKETPDAVRLYLNTGVARKSPEPETTKY
jgi:hypothetical protein